MRFQAPRGTQDILPETSYLWRTIENLFIEIAEHYGYHEIRTPMFEETELFVRSTGTTSDIVSKEMYTFLDKSNRSLTLKPEGTAGVARALIEHGLAVSGQLRRLWYITPNFRYDRPQKGRYRQFHQAGLELIGSTSAFADLEIIEMTYHFYKALGLDNITVYLNSLGNSESKVHFAEAILKHANSFLKSQSTEAQEKAQKNPLRLLDSKDSEIIEMMTDAPSILNFIDQVSKKHFEELKKLLTEATIPYQVNSKIVRGLDYYTSTVFEVQTEHLGAQNALCGGGRYDNLVKELDGPNLPCVGVGIGIERALLINPPLLQQTLEPRLDFFVISATESAQKSSRLLVRKLRNLNFSVNFDLDQKSLKSQIKQADRLRSRFAILLGEDEMQNECFTLKNLETGEQKSIKMNEVLSLKDYLIPL